MGKTLPRFRILLIAATCMLIAPLAHGQTLFQDDFERGNLDQWVVKGGRHHGQIVADPLDPTGANHALNFTALNAGGDIFTASPIDISGVTGTIILSFDYLGLANGDPNPNDLGGFIGISTNRTPGNQGVDHFWLAGTEPSAAFSGYGYSAEQLIDDGTWHHYDLDFTNIFLGANLQNIYILIEQWNGAGGLPGHAYFDNIQLHTGDGQILFQDNFERGKLDQWAAKGGGHHGQIVPDPLDSTGANHALNFTALNAGGDIFTASPIDISGVTGTIVLSFDYLGLANGDPNPNDLGGFIGISTNLAPGNQGVDHFWLAGTEPSAAFSGYGYSAEQLIDDGTWHHYDLDFTNIFLGANLQNIYILIEQWSGAGGLPGHAYFDNIRLQAMP